MSFQTGLLGPSGSEYYTHAMDLAATADLVTNFSTFLNTAIDEDLSSMWPRPASAVSYLATIANKVAEFAATGEVIGRTQEREALRAFCLKKGTMAFVCGGLSIGKTRLMNEVTKEIEAGTATCFGKVVPVKVLYYNGRLEAAQKSLQQPSANFFEKLKFALGFGPASLEISGLLTAAAVTQAVNKLRKTGGDTHLVIVLDEANVFVEKTGKAAEGAVRLFRTLVAYIKENRISVVLLSSDESLPFRMADMGLRTSHVNRVLAIGDVAPSEMLSLLRTLGVGKSLSELLVRVYGGHFWNIRNACEHLHAALEMGRTPKVWPQPKEDIQHAFALWEEAGGDRKVLVEVLKEVARVGFCRLDAKAAVARALTKANVCMYLPNTADEFFIDPVVRQDNAGVAASSQLVRVLIPIVLKELGCGRGN